MALNKTLKFAVEFAVKAEVYKLSVSDLAELVNLNEAAFRANEHECNTGKSADKACKKVSEQAKRMGLEVYWPGLYPAFRKNGENVWLPTTG